MPSASAIVDSRWIIGATGRGLNRNLAHRDVMGSMILQTHTHTERERGKGGRGRGREKKKEEEKEKERRKEIQ